MHRRRITQGRVCIQGFPVGGGVHLGSTHLHVCVCVSVFMRGFMNVNDLPASSLLVSSAPEPRCASLFLKAPRLVSRRHRRRSKSDSSHPATRHTQPF